MKVVVALGVLLAVLLLADRGAALLAERAVATQLQRSAELPGRPEVDVRGFPFLTQAVSGRYDDVAVRAAGVPAGPVVIDDLEALLSGVRVPLRDALGGNVTAVPVERVNAEVLVSYDELSSASGDRGLEVTYGGEPDLVRVTGSVGALDRELEVTATSRVDVQGDEVVFTARSFEVGSDSADSALRRALAERLDLRVSVRDLPYGLELTGLRTTPEGTELTAAATDVVLTAR